LLWVHPFWQIAAIALGFYVFYLGWARFAAASLGRKKTFLWKRHVTAGKVALYAWIYGALVGAAASWVQWRSPGVTGTHFWIGAAIVLLSIFGYWSGLRMDTHKKRRKVLPILHGANNLLLLLLTLVSVATGIEVFFRLIPG
jgi:uncharacterized membrane protein YozB (DUF420 family)